MISWAAAPWWVLPGALAAGLGLLVMVYGWGVACGKSNADNATLEHLHKLEEVLLKHVASAIQAHVEDSAEEFEACRKAQEQRFMEHKREFERITKEREIVWKKIEKMGETVQDIAVAVATIKGWMEKGDNR